MAHMLAPPLEDAAMLAPAETLASRLLAPDRLMVQTFAAQSVEPAPILNAALPTPPDGAVHDNVDGLSAADAFAASRMDSTSAAQHWPVPIPLELRLPEITLRELHSDSHGSLARFLLDVRAALAKLAGVEEPRIGVVSIHERFQRLGPANHTERIEATSQNTHVLIRLEVLPGAGRDAEDVARRLTEDAGVALGRLEPLAKLLCNATLAQATSRDLVAEAAARVAREQGRAAGLSAMVLPIGIAAAFTWTVVWFAQ